MVMPVPSHPCLPPGPRSLTWGDRLRFSFMPPGPLLARFAERYGDPFRIVTPEESVTFTGDPALIRDVYTADPDVFDPRGVDVTAPIFGSTSIPVSTGARHKRDRKLLSPPFQAGAMRAYGSTIAEITRSRMASFEPGRPFSMLEATQSMALDVIIRVVYGVEEEAELQKTRATVLELIHSLNPLVLVFPWLRRSFGGYGPWARLVRAGEALESMVVAQTRTKRAAKTEGTDILTVLTRVRDEHGDTLTDMEIAEQLRAILFAGHETTAVAIAALVDSLHRDRALLSRVQAEVDALGPYADPDALASLPFLEAACYEALRMHPPVVDPGRVVRSPITLGGYRFPRGEAIVPSPLLLHRREDLYPAPEQFRPERFLGKKPSPFEFIAFGGGARRCLGAAFALFEMKVIVGTLLREARLRPVSAAPIEQIRRGITLGPRGTVPMVLEGKRAPRSASLNPAPRPAPAACPAASMNLSRCPFSH